MRVVGGDFKGRKFGPKMKKWPTRPTTDYAKESIFNVLNNLFYFDDKTVLDLFAGTGSISLEFLSRGVDSVTIVEDYLPCIKYIKSLMLDFDQFDKVNVIAMDVLKFIENHSQVYNFIFIDPPYSLPQMNDIPDLIFKKGLLHPEGMMILEHSNLNNFSQHPRCTKVKKYGQTVVSFFEHEA